MTAKDVHLEIENIGYCLESIECLDSQVQYFEGLKPPIYEVTESSISDLKNSILKVKSVINVKVLKIKDHLDNYLISQMEDGEEPILNKGYNNGFNVGNLLIDDKKVFLTFSEDYYIELGSVDIHNLEEQSPVFAEFNGCNPYEVLEGDQSKGWEFPEKLIEY